VALQATRRKREKQTLLLSDLYNFDSFFSMLTIISYIGLLIGALGFTLTIYLGLVKVVKLI
jgi:hypothetical protein